MKIVTFGEMMLRLAPPGFQRLTQARAFDVMYGGGEANVAVSLANYGEMAEFVTRCAMSLLATKKTPIKSSASRRPKPM